MRKITDEGFLFLYGAGLLVTAETGIPAVITILFACIYTCVTSYMVTQGCRSIFLNELVIQLRECGTC